MTGSPVYLNPEVLARIANLQLKARRPVEGTISGQHKSPFHGFNVEFASYREYAPGDDLKRLDWRVLAKTDRFYIKQYEQESNLRAMLVVDGSASMRYGPSGRTKFDYAATLATCLASVMIDQQDPVGLALFDTQRRFHLPPVATQSQLMQVAGSLQDCKPSNDTDLGAVLDTLGEELKRRGMVLVFSDLLTDLDKFYAGLDRIRYRGHEMIVFHILDRDEIEMPFKELVQFKDIEGQEELFAEPWGFRKAYKQAMETFIQEVRSACGERSIDYVLSVTDDDAGELLSNFLHGRARSQHVRAETHGKRHH